MIASSIGGVIGDSVEDGASGSRAKNEQEGWRYDGFWPRSGSLESLADQVNVKLDLAVRKSVRAAIAKRMRPVS